MSRRRGDPAPGGGVGRNGRRQNSGAQGALGGHRPTGGQKWEEYEEARSELRAGHRDAGSLRREEKSTKFRSETKGAHGPGIFSWVSGER